jgi:hypothetical protein
VIFQNGRFVLARLLSGNSVLIACPKSALITTSSQMTFSPFSNSTPRALRKEAKDVRLMKLREFFPRCASRFGLGAYY